MRAVLFVVVGVVAIVGCTTKRNPNACCTNAVECADIGFDEITPCLGVKVCIDGSCEDPTCTTSSDCTDPAAPYCVGTTCVADCGGDITCPEASEPHCASDGVCVGCLQNADCLTAELPVCDEDDRACRGCVDDGECASGICLASEGVCASEDQVVFVSTDGADAGACTSDDPCATVTYGLSKITGVRRVLRIVSLNYATSDGIVIDRDVYLDTAGTRLTRETTGPIITFENGCTAVFEDARLISGQPPQLLVTDYADVTAYDLSLELGTAKVGETFFTAALHFLHGTVDLGGFDCTQVSSLEIRDSDLENGAVSINGCNAVIARNRFKLSEGTVGINAQRYGDIVVENNLFESNIGGQGGFAQFFNEDALGSDVAIRFNTFIATNANERQAVFGCSPGPNDEFVVSSNVFILDPAPLFSSESSCVVDHSLFEETAGALPGEGNLAAPLGDIFVDLAGGDFRPAAGSPARGAGDPAQDPGEDLDGNPRPVPAGSPPDIGAFEVE